MWQYGDEIIRTPKEMVINDVRYPKQIFNDADFLADLGITSYTPPATADQRYYNGTTDNPRNVDDLKKVLIERVKTQVGARLSKTDWMVIRASEGGTAVPSDITTYRTGIRTEGNTKETEINAITTLQGVIDYENASFTQVRKEEVYTDGVFSGYSDTETRTATVIIDKCMHFTTTDPQAETDDGFVSLTED